MENEKWKCECGYEAETEHCPNCGRGRDGSLPDDFVQEENTATVNEEPAKQENDQSIKVMLVDEQPAPEGYYEEEEDEEEEDDEEEVASEEPAEELQPEEPSEKEPVIDKKSADEKAKNDKAEKAAMAKEIKALKKEVENLRKQLAEERLANKRAVSTPQKAINIKHINLHYAKDFMHKWPVLIIAVLLTVMSLVTFTRLVSDFNWVTLIETVLILPVELIGTVGLWRMFAAGTSNREDLDFSKGPDMIKRALKVTKAYVFIVMTLVCIGIVLVLFAAGGSLGEFGDKIAARLPVSINVDFWTIGIVIFVCALVFTVAGIFFGLTGKMLDNVVNRAKNGKEYAFRCMGLSIITFIIGIVVLVAVCIMMSNKESLCEMLTGFTEAVDWVAFLDVPKFIIGFAGSASLLFMGVQALCYKRIQATIQDEIDSL